MRLPRIGFARGPLEPWRKAMLAGALLLWIFYMTAAMAGSDGPDWLRFVVNFTGYGFLSVGFVLRMRARKEQAEAEEAAAASRPAEDPAPD